MEKEMLGDDFCTCPSCTGFRETQDNIIKDNGVLNININSTSNLVTLLDYIKSCGQIAKEHGWDDKPVSIPEDIALMHSELSEALEEFRADTDMRRIYEGSIQNKPEGILVELADVCIRIFHFAAKHGVEDDFIRAMNTKMGYNMSRPYRHGGKIL